MKWNCAFKCYWLKFKHRADLCDQWFVLIQKFHGHFLPAQTKIQNYHENAELSCTNKKLNGLNLKAKIWLCKYHSCFIINYQHYSLARYPEQLIIKSSIPMLCKMHIYISSKFFSVSSKEATCPFAVYHFLPKPTMLLLEKLG